MTNENQNPKFSAIVLASGKGTRMKSKKPKVLTDFDGKPMVERVVQALSRAGSDDIIVTVCNNADMIMSALESHEVTFAKEISADGTGSSALAGLELAKNDVTVVINGDQPMVQPGAIRSVLESFIEQGYTAAPVSWVIDDAGSYGRIVRGEKGEFLKIVESSDCSQSQLEIGEYNVGTYVFKTKEAREYMSRIDNNNAKAEYYITDVFSLMGMDGLSVGCIKGDETLAIGVNTVEELQSAIERYREISSQT